MESACHCILQDELAAKMSPGLGAKGVKSAREARGNAASSRNVEIISIAIRAKARKSANRVSRREPAPFSYMAGEEKAAGRLDIKTVRDIIHLVCQPCVRQQRSAYGQPPNIKEDPEVVELRNRSRHNASLSAQVTCTAFSGCVTLAKSHK